jgi:hypothetical protein
MTDTLDVFAEELRALIEKTREPDKYAHTDGSFLKAMQAILLHEAAQLHGDARVKESHAHHFLLHRNDLLISFPQAAKTQMQTLLETKKEGE